MCLHHISYLQSALNEGNKRINWGEMLCIVSDLSYKSHLICTYVYGHGCLQQKKNYIYEALSSDRKCFSPVSDANFHIWWVILSHLMSLCTYTYMYAISLRESLQLDISLLW